jgi:serine protease
MIRVYGILTVMMVNALVLIAKNEEMGFMPNDPDFSLQWGLYNSNDGFDIEAIKAWQIERGSKKVAIVVIDTGIDYTHPDLVNNMWVNPNEIPGNGIDDDGNGYIDDIHGINAITNSGDPMDDNGHGTMVTGVIGAEGNNGIGIAGVMHNVSLIACKFLDAEGGGKTSDVLKCLDYVTDLAHRDIGVTIVATNNAWGGGEFNLDMLNAINQHKNLGIIFVAGAGSDSSDLDQNALYPASYHAANIIVVAKTRSDGVLTFFSNFGANSVHIAAPGSEILTTALNGEYTKFSGSPATGFVSGVIGLLKSNNPHLSWAQIKHKLLAGSKNLADPSDRGKLITGGQVNAFNSLKL